MRLIFFALLLAGVTASNISYRFQTYEEGAPCTLIRTENVVRDEESVYRVFCQQETFDLTDDWWTGNFLSSDLYGQLSSMPPGTELKFDVYGVRSGFFSTKRQAFRIHQN